MGRGQGNVGAGSCWMGGGQGRYGGGIERDGSKNWSEMSWQRWEKRNEMRIGQG